MIMAQQAPPPGMKKGQMFTAHCRLPTADYPHFHDKSKMIHAL
jgi:hypothetical protein